MEKIILAGGSGFLGRALATHLEKAGYDVAILTRSAARADVYPREVHWDAQSLGPWTAELEGAAAVINLAGRSVDCRYTAKNRRAIMESRIHSTRVIGQAIAGAEQPPRLWLNASTATIYRYTFGPAWDEGGAIGATAEAKDTFSIEVARAWEDELNRARAGATRKVALRISMVLGTGKNSVFPVLMRLVRCGLGGKHGSGRQFVSWIDEVDFCRAIEWVKNREDLAGAINFSAPNPLTNSEMMRTLRETAGIPFGLPATPWMLEIGAFFLRTETELILKSRRVVPGRLLDSGFEFRFPDFRGAAEHTSKRMDKAAP